jgi:hypothetical protein
MIASSLNRFHLLCSFCSYPANSNTLIASILCGRFVDPLRADHSNWPLLGVVLKMAHPDRLFRGLWLDEKESGRSILNGHFFRLVLLRNLKRDAAAARQGSQEQFPITSPSRPHRGRKGQRFQEK